MNRRHALVCSLVVLVSVLTGCEHVPLAKDGQQLQPGHGLVAFHITSNAVSSLAFNDYASESTFGSRFNEYMAGAKGAVQISPGETYYVLQVEAGEYMWSRFDLQDYQQSFAWLQATNRFRVYPNAVTYIGHIRINVDSPRMFGRRGFNLAVVDGDDDMRAHLVRAYPDYAHKLPYYKQITDLRRR